MQEGSVVKSMAGHDKNKYYVVVRVQQIPECVYIADGRARTLEKPKRKNTKHVQGTNMVLDLESVATNKKLRQALAARTGGAGTTAEGGNELCPR